MYLGAALAAWWPVRHGVAEALQPSDSAAD